MPTLILLRHGESTWNSENRFTGWTDVPLSETGRREAHEAARLLREAGHSFDVAYTSVLKRAIQTLSIVQEDCDLEWVPVVRDWRLNERHYGALQGLNKAETAQKYGEGQVKIWRRSADTRPPALEVSDERHPSHDPRYAMIEPALLPSAECLRDTASRVRPCWEADITPRLHAGQTVLIAAHGNSLRSIVWWLDGLSDEEIVELNIPTGIPLVYELDESLRPVSKRYLGDPALVAAAAARVAAQGKATTPPLSA